MKQGLLAGKIILLTAACNAFAEEHDFEGFFVQGAIGYDAFLAEDSAISSASYEALSHDHRSASLNNSHHEYSDGVAADLSVGYIYPVNELFSIGAELGLGILREEITVSSNQTNTDAFDGYSDSAALHSKDEISREALEPTLDLLLGVTPTDDIMIFGLIGMAYNEVELTSINTFDYSAINSKDEHAYAFTQTYEQDSNTDVFLRLGLGMFYELYEDVVFNVTYVYTDYADLSTHTSEEIILCQPEGSDPDNNCGPTGTITSKSDADVSDNRVLVGLNYFF